jgi:hypothetical protein
MMHLGRRGPRQGGPERNAAGREVPDRPRHRVLLGYRRVPPAYRRVPPGCRPVYFRAAGVS